MKEFLLIKNVFDKPIDGKFPDICIIELGGGVNGELSDKKFLQALSSEFKHKTEFLHVHISKLVAGKLGFLEKSVQNLRNNNWKPDIIICRSTTPFSDVYKKHISHFAELNIDMVINLPDVPNVKWVPIKLQEQNIYNLIANELQLKKIGPNFETKMNELKNEIKKAESYKTVVKIALVAKYQSEGNEICQDSYESMVQQLNIAAEKSCFCKVEINFIRAQDFEDEASKDIQKTAWTLLKEAQGIIIPGGYGDEAFKGFFKACKYARINKKPFLSICCGFQCAVAEFAQNVCGINYFEACEKELEKILIKMLENGAPRMGQHTVTF
uniref:CTP synthase n=1 Tax=Panagrolaimus davidi TaxID=227884 RepID=A0A914RAT4_9BILA